MDSLDFTQTLKTILLPPSLYFVWLGLAMIALPRFYRTGMWMLALLFLTIYFTSIPFTANRMIAILENNYEVLSDKELKNTSAKAIVVLGAGRNRNAREYGEDTVSAMALERIRYAAKIKKLTNLPLIVSGGKRLPIDKPEALLLKRTLQEEFQVSVEETELHSRTTWENAFETRKLLASRSIDEVILVTHAWHMPRAVYAFDAAGIKVVPAPTAFVHINKKVFGVKSFIPMQVGFNSSYIASHELLGRLWYGIKNYFKEDMGPVLANGASPSTENKENTETDAKETSQPSGTKTEPKPN